MSDSFHDVVLHDGLIVYETDGGPEYETDVVIVGSGDRYRNSSRDEGLYRANVGNRVVTLDELQSDLKFFRARKGKAIGFLVKDWGDFTCPSSEGRLGQDAIGTGIPTYDCWRRYADAAGSDFRRLWKLKTGTVTVYRNASPVTVGGGAGQVAIDVTTGRVTFVADDSEAVTGHTPGASHQFTTAADITVLSVGEKVYLSGCSVSGGTDVVNGVAHTISGKSGAGPYTWTISTNTTGRTVSGGTAYAYPQAADTLTFAAEFYVPVCFDTDAFKYRFLAKDGANSLFEIAALPVVELLTP